MSKILQIGKYNWTEVHGGIENVCAAIHDDNRLDITSFVYSKKRGFSSVESQITEFHCSHVGSQPVSFRMMLAILCGSRKFDVLILHAPNPLYYPVAILCSIWLDIIVFWHSDVIGKKSYFMIKMFEYLLLTVAKRVVVTSHEYAVHSNPLSNIDNDKVIICPLGAVGFPEYHKSAAHTDKRRILLLGRLVPYKGHRWFLNVMQKLPDDYELHIVGTGPLDHLLKSEVLRLRLNERVTFHGSTTELELSKLFQLVDLLVLPSINRAEAFGVVLLEAISAGLPIVVNNVEGSGMVEVARSGDFGLVAEYCDPNSWMECIDYIFDGVNYARMSKSAKQCFEANYSVGSFQNRFMKIIGGM